MIIQLHVLCMFSTIPLRSFILKCIICFFTILHIHYVIISVYPKSMVCKETYKCVTYYSILIAVFSIFHIKMPAKGNMTKPSLYEHINLKAI